MKAIVARRQAMLINPRTLTVQGKPIWGSNCLTTMGYMQPPNELPVVTIATAKARFFVK
jgi:hypothetical protein